MTFEERAQQAATGWVASSEHLIEAAYVAGTIWGREQGFMEAVEMLKSTGAEERSMRADTNPDEETAQLYGPAWADWLLEQRKKE